MIASLPLPPFVARPYDAKYVALFLTCQEPGCPTNYGPYALVEPNDHVMIEQYTRHQASIRAWRFGDGIWRCAACGEAPL